MVNPIDIAGNTEEEEEEEEEDSYELILFKLIMMKDTFELNSLVLALLTFTLFKVIKLPGLLWLFSSNSFNLSR